MLRALDADLSSAMCTSCLAQGAGHTAESCPLSDAVKQLKANKAVLAEKAQNRRDAARKRAEAQTVVRAEVAHKLWEVVHPGSQGPMPVGRLLDVHFSLLELWAKGKLREEARHLWNRRIRGAVKRTVAVEEDAQVAGRIEEALLVLVIG